MPQPRARCFYCDSLLDDDKARVSLPDGKIYGPCCEDIAGWTQREPR